MATKIETKQRSGKSELVIPIMLIAIAVVMLLGIFGFYSSTRFLVQETLPTQMQEQIASSEPETLLPVDQEIVKQGTATIGVMGDLLLHDQVITSGYDAKNETYNFDRMFDFLETYLATTDYAVANLEVTLCGEDNGYGYSGEICFNAPDAIVDAAKKAGFDMLLTANNHSYDTGRKGFFRTQEVLKNRKVDYIGTRYNEKDKNYIIKDINGIKIGMICYTYNTGEHAKGNISLNSIPLTVETSGLINTFNYGNLDRFYGKLSEELIAMQAEGAEATMLYIHWGDEYNIQANATQKKMAQDLCDMGIDVIVGNHAHVVQPIELLTNSQDTTKKTLCLYSAGNVISDIRRGETIPAEAEDGMLFSVTFARYSNGTVVVEGADVMPTWVNRYTQDSQNFYKIMTLHTSDSHNWRESMGLTHDMLKVCQESYDRTMQVVGSGLEEANAYFVQNQAEVEKQLGITE